jgi:hypothetical protein
MDRLAGSWNGDQKGREVERIPSGQMATSVVVEARWESSSVPESFNCGVDSPEFCQTAISVVGT